MFDPSKGDSRNEIPHNKTYMKKQQFIGPATKETSELVDAFVGLILNKDKKKSAELRETLELAKLKNSLAKKNRSNV